MFPIIQVLGFPIPIGPVSLLLAFYFGTEVGARSILWLHPGRNAEKWTSLYSNATSIGFAVGLVAARLGYAIRYADLYLQDPALLISLQPGTLAFLPGLLVGVGTAFFYLQRHQVPVPIALDASAAGLTLGILIIRIGQFLTGDAYGLATNVPWAIELWGASRHPVQLYSAGALILIGLLLWLYRRNTLPGETFWRFVVLYALSELILRAYRANSPTWGPGVRLDQVVALSILLGGLFILSFYAASRVKASTPSGSQDIQSNTI